MVKKLVFVMFCTALLSFYILFQGVHETYQIEINHEKSWEEISDVPDILRDPLFGAKNQADFINIVKEKMKKIGIDLTNISGSGFKDAEEEEARALKKLQIERFIAFDENFDSVVTKEEIRERINKKHKDETAAEKQRIFVKVWAGFYKSDTDQNQEISYAEAGVLEEPAKTRMQNFSAEYEKYSQLDPDKDGVLTLEELEQLLGNLFEKFDENKDGVFTEDEKMPYLNARQAYRKIYGGDVQKCEMPKPDGETDVLVIKVRHGKALSNVTVIGQDKVTEVTRVFIDKAQEDVYLILSSTEAMIWLFEGNTAAVKKVIINSASHSANERGYSGGGVVGVERENVTFLHKHCLPVLGGNKNVVAENVRKTIVRLIGREPDLMKDSDNNVKVIQISGGEISVNKAENAGLSENIKRLKEADFHSGTWNEFEMQYPGGVFDFNPQDVISDAGVVRYDILPVMAGVSQLIARGYLERISDDEFRIIKDLPRVPAGLSGGRNGIKFFISPNVDISADFKSFCVIKEGTNEILSHESVCH